VSDDATVVHKQPKVDKNTDRGPPVCEYLQDMVE